MIARATSKAATAGLDVSFRTAVTEALPFADGTFDVELSTLMLRHLPRKAREQCLKEIRRVLSPKAESSLWTSERRKTNRASWRIPTHARGRIAVIAILLLIAAQAVLLGVASSLHYSV